MIVALGLFQAGLCGKHLRLRLLDGNDFQFVIHDDQGLALMDPVADLDGDSGHAARGLGADDHVAHRGDGSHGGDGFCQRAYRHRGGLNGNGVCHSLDRIGSARTIGKGRDRSHGENDDAYPDRAALEY